MNHPNAEIDATMRVRRWRVSYDPPARIPIGSKLLPESGKWVLNNVENISDSGFSAKYKSPDRNCALQRYTTPLRMPVRTQANTPCIERNFYWILSAKVPTLNSVVRDAWVGNKKDTMILWYDAKDHPAKGGHEWFWRDSNGELRLVPGEHSLTFKNLDPSPLSPTAEEFTPAKSNALNPAAEEFNPGEKMRS